MEIETLKRKIDRIAARKMIAESEAFFDKRKANPVWSERLCEWCGMEFNQTEAESKCYCCGECRAQASKASRQASRPVKNKIKHAHEGPTLREADLSWLSRIKDLFGRGRFSSIQLAEAYHADVRRVRESLKRLVDVGRVVGTRGFGGVYEWRLA